MAANKTGYVGSLNPTTAAAVNTAAGPSPIIWGDFQIEAIKEDGNLGVYFLEQFLGWSGTVSSNVGTYVGDSGAWTSWEATSGSIIGESRAPNGPSAGNVACGSILMAASTTAHNSATIQKGKASGAFGVSNVAGSLPKVYFECRVLFKVAPAANTKSYFFGFLSPAMTTAENAVLTTTDALVTTNNFIGFLQANAGAILPVYGAAAASTTVGTLPNAAAIPSTLTNWTKLGFVYDPLSTYAALRYYQDGLLVGVSTATPSSNWPSNAAMTPTITYQLGGTSTTDSKLAVDWVSAGLIWGVE